MAPEKYGQMGPKFDSSLVYCLPLYSMYLQLPNFKVTFLKFFLINTKIWQLISGSWKAWLVKSLVRKKVWLVKSGSWSLAREVWLAPTPTNFVSSKNAQRDA